MCGDVRFRTFFFFFFISISFSLSVYAYISLNNGHLCFFFHLTNWRYSQTIATIKKKGGIFKIKSVCVCLSIKFCKTFLILTYKIPTSFHGILEIFYSMSQFFFFFAIVELSPFPKLNRVKKNCCLSTKKGVNFCVGGSKINFVVW